MDKVRVIERSLLCFTLGCNGLIPVLGLIPAAWAVLLYHSVRYEAGHNWNPAEHHARWGYILAWTGLGVSTVAMGGAFVCIVPSLF